MLKRSRLGVHAWINLQAPLHGARQVLHGEHYSRCDLLRNDLRVASGGSGQQADRVHMQGHSTLVGVQGRSECRERGRLGQHGAAQLVMHSSLAHRNPSSVARSDPQPGGSVEGAH